jgi:hypothetical protein
MPPVSIAPHVPDQRRRAIHQHEKNPGLLQIARQEFFGHVVLAFSRRTIDDVNMLLLRAGAHTAAESAGRAHQISVVECVVVALQVAPPRSKSPATARQRNIGIQDDPVDAIVLADQQIGVGKAQRACSNRGKSPKRVGDSLSTAPQGPLFPGAVPEKA